MTTPCCPSHPPKPTTPRQTYRRPGHPTAVVGRLCSHRLHADRGGLTEPRLLGGRGSYGSRGEKPAAAQTSGVVHSRPHYNRTAVVSQPTKPTVNTAVRTIAAFPAVVASSTRRCGSSTGLPHARHSPGRVRCTFPQSVQRQSFIVFTYRVRPWKALPKAAGVTSLTAPLRGQQRPNGGDPDPP